MLFNQFQSSVTTRFIYLNMFLTNPTHCIGLVLHYFLFLPMVPSWMWGSCHSSFVPFFQIISSLSNQTRSTTDCVASVIALLDDSWLCVILVEKFVATKWNFETSLVNLFSLFFISYISFRYAWRCFTLPTILVKMTAALSEKHGLDL